MNSNLVNDAIVFIMCTACGGAPAKGVVTSLEYMTGEWEVSDDGDRIEFICQRCKAYPGLDPDVLFTDRGGKLWIERIPLHSIDSNSNNA